MKRRIAVLILCLAFLPGCSSMLNRSYQSVTTHDPFSGGGANPSALRAENYQGLVEAVFYLVSQCAEQGEIELYNYTGDVDADLNRACLEVAAEDPLGAYCVDYIKSDYTKIISNYDANVYIAYRRTPTQVKSIVSVTGSSAIRGELRDALARFAPESVLRVSSFSEDEASILSLIHEAYYSTPEAAFGLPDIVLAIYPESGTQRIVEILLTYPEEPELLRQKQETLLAAARDMAEPMVPLAPSSRPAALFAALRALSCAPGDEDGPGESAYALLVDGSAGFRGFALSWLLLSRQLGMESVLVRGTLDGAPWWWNMVRTEDGWLHVDATSQTGLMRTGQEMSAQGYAWEAEQPVA